MGDLLAMIFLCVGERGPVTPPAFKAVLGGTHPSAPKRSTGKSLDSKGNSPVLIMYQPAARAPISKTK
jgi:hypothetical protein